MNWLNINLSTLRSPAYIGSSPTERATWLQVLAYCVDQENGGRIAGAASWKDRQWQQACGVTAREVRASGRLMSFDGQDLNVSFYPVEKEREVIDNREAGRRGGGASTAKKIQASRTNGSLGGRPKCINNPSVNPSDILIINPSDGIGNPSVNPTEGEEKDKDNRKEGEREGNGVRASDILEFEAFWSCYPKKRKQGEAQRVWSDMVDRPSLEVLLAAVEIQKLSDDWKDKKGQFIPNPDNWLADKRWLDEQPKPPSTDYTDWNS